MPFFRATHSLRALALALAIGVIAIAACKGGNGDAHTAAAPGDTLSDSALMSRADIGRYEGDAKAPIWIVMVSDFQCPFCKVWHDSTLAEVRANYVATGKARLAYLNFPLQIHHQARAMTQAAMCASAQNKFWQFADTMFSRQRAIGETTDSKPALDAIARELNLDSASYQHCLRSSAINALVQSDIQQGIRGNVKSTPSFIIGNFLLEGAMPFYIFKTAVDSALVLAEKKH